LIVCPWPLPLSSLQWMCQWQGQAGPGRAPDWGRCWERQNETAGSRACGAKFVVSLLCCPPSWLSSRELGPFSCCLLRLRDPQPKSPFLSRADLGPANRTKDHSSSPNTNLSNASLVWIKGLSTACHEPLTICPWCTDFARQFRHFLRVEASPARDASWCTARRSARSRVLCAWLLQRPSKSGRPTPPLLLHELQPATTHVAPPPPIKTNWVCMSIGHSVGRSISIPSSRSTPTALRHVDDQEDPPLHQQP
jgi:hypothetical protein